MSFTKDDAIILHGFLRVGDEVIVQRFGDPDAGYISDLPPDGTRAQVIEIPTFNHYVQHNECDSGGHAKPGIYETYGAPIFLYEVDSQWKRSDLPPAYLVFANDVSKESRRNDAHWNKDSYGVYVGPLPKVPYFVGDKVQVAGRGTDVATGSIKSIKYQDLGRYTHRGNELSIVDVQLDEGGSIWACRHELSLLKRGNYYHYYEGSKDDIVFVDLREEAAFYTSLGFSEQLRSPVSGNYCWDIDEAVTAVRENRGDLIRMSGGMFGSAPFPTLYRFPELPDLGRRLREATVEGFKDRVAV